MSGDLILAAWLGFAIGVLWQEIHFRHIGKQLDELEKRITDG